MSPVVIILATVSALSLGLAALMLGLWLGERGRRRSAEALVEVGQFTRRAARRLSAERSAEERATRAGQPFSDETIARGVTQYMAEMQAAGFQVTDAEAREHVKQMLWEAEGGGLRAPDELEGLFT